MDQLFIGVDIGGMSIKAALVNRQGEIKYKTHCKTDAKQGPGVFLKDVRNLILEIIDFSKAHDSFVGGIGFGVPGVVNNIKGTIDYAPNLYMENVSFKEYFKDLNIPIFLSNDANVACLAEVRFGAAKDYNNVVLLTLGTGIGGGIVINNELYEGNEGKGAEIGHTVLVVDGEQCGCGRKGCFEAYASASSLLRYTRNEMINNPNSLMWKYCKGNIENVDGKTSFECAKKGDISANFVIDNYIKYLSEGILNICNIFRPEAILIGGGLSNQGDYLLSKIIKYCSERDYGYKNTPKPEFLICKLKNDAGVIGAAALAMEKMD